MTALIEQAVTDVPEDDALAFPPEHYGCPPWCTVNDGVGANHDSADGLPDCPKFGGYWHWTGLWIPYAAYLYPRRNPNRLPIRLDLERGTAEPVIAIGNPTDDWAEFTLDEAAHVCAEIRHMVTAYGQPACPAWCEQDHRRYPSEDNCHYASASIKYASAPAESGHANPYGVDLYQPEPKITLSDGVHQGVRDVIVLKLREAAQVAAAIAELVGAAREGRPVSAAARETWSS